MSAPTPAGGERPMRSASSYETRDMGEVRLRRREARDAQRKSRLLRLDLGLGVLVAIVLLLATPGVAFAAIIALLVLAACAGSVVVERWRARRRASRS